MGFGIDVGSSTLKIVQVNRTLKGFRVVGAARRRLPKIDKPEESRQVVGRSVRELLGLREGRVGVVGLSGRDINLKLVQQAQMPAVNYRTMMGYEVDQARGSENALYGDFCTLREPDPYFPGYLAMVGLGKVSYVDERIGAAQAAALDVRDAVPTPFALYIAYRNAYGVENGTILLLDIGADNTDVAIVRGGRLIFCRNVSTGSRVFDQNISGMAGIGVDEAEARKIQYGNLGQGGDGADPREDEVRPAVRTSAGQLAGIIQSSINFAKTQLNDRELAIDKIYLSGGGARLRGLLEYLASATKIPVELLNPFQNVELGPMQEQDDFKSLPTDMAEALGLAQISAGGGAGVLSILPDRLKARRNFMRGTMFLVVAGIALGVGLVAATVLGLIRRGTAAGELAKFNAETSAVNQRVQQLDNHEEELRKLVAKRRLLDSHVVPGRNLLDAVQKLRRTLPDGIYIRGLEFVNLADDRNAETGPRRVVFGYPGRGILEGIVQRGKGLDPANDPELKIRLVDAGAQAEPESFSRASMAGTIHVESPWLAVVIRGEIDETIKGGPGTVLDDIRLQFTDPVRGVTAELHEEGASTRAGWRGFRILLRTD